MSKLPAVTNEYHEFGEPVELSSRLLTSLRACIQLSHRQLFERRSVVLMYFPDSVDSTRVTIYRSGKKFARGKRTYSSTLPTANGNVL